MQLKQTITPKKQKPLLYAKEFYDWPKYWMGLEEDLAVGEKKIKQVFFCKF